MLPQNVMVYYKNRNVIVYTHNKSISIGKKAGILHGGRLTKHKAWETTLLTGSLSKKGQINATFRVTSTQPLQERSYSENSKRIAQNI